MYISTVETLSNFIRLLTVFLKSLGVISSWRLLELYSANLAIVPSRVRSRTTGSSLFSCLSLSLFLSPPLPLSALPAPPLSPLLLSPHCLDSPFFSVLVFLQDVLFYPSDVRARPIVACFTKSMSTGKCSPHFINAWRCLLTATPTDDRYFMF